MRTSVPLLLAITIIFPSSAVLGQDNQRRGEPEARRPKPVEKIVDEGHETATHQEVEPLEIEFKRLSALAMYVDGNLLASDADTKEIMVIDSLGELQSTINLEITPEALCVAADGTIYCGGRGKLVKLGKDGAVLKMADIPRGMTSTISSKRRKRSKPPRVSGIAVSDRDVFVAYGAGWSLGSKSKLFRVDRDLENPKTLAEGLRGCCQRCDIVSLDGDVYVAENSVHRVVRFNREGNVLSRWGERRRTGLEGFGACCNPMNLCFDASGKIYTSESGMGRVKCYTIDGKFLDLVGYVGVKRFRSAGRVASSCSNIAIAATPDGRRVYVMDLEIKRIRVLVKKLRSHAF